jgi:hypothetical protein
MSDQRTTLDELARELDPAAQRALEQLSGVAPLALEACLRIPAAPGELVAGFGALHRDHVIAAAQLVAPAHAARVARWLDALPGTTDVGFKLAGRPGDLQIYARGDYAPAELVTAFDAAEVARSPVVIRNGLALFDQRTAHMVGLELRDADASGAVYAAVRRTRALARAISDAFGFLATALVPDAVAVWSPVAPILLEAAGEEIAYVSFAPIERDGWVKLDVAERPIAVARRVVEAAGFADAWTPVLAQVQARAIERWSHIGVRLARGGGTIVLYHAVT